ncbi:hypothetical protein AHMF7605_09595 [Adhaeribacter arboris]|uniref:Bestrophin n=1 Tax=Adhaeribacter arboris TaxID=2072846 RepID=A0A2T2YE13_9BACT|nr:bestrophin family ion channel [Adhaeribacter arboris]PSR53759.1 hypothetical protein AHMF7605_09595 [Adhaeribacter arboris]
MLIEKRIPFKYLFNKIKLDVLRVFLFSILFQILKHFFVDYLPAIPITLPSILGTSISLILAFKLNHSYDRWWEARKIWGAIVNDSRTLILQVKGFANNNVFTPVDSIIKRMAFRQIGWCYSLGQSLRGLNPLADLDTYISAEEIAYIQPQTNKPLALLMGHVNDIKLLQQNQAINAYQQIQLDQTLVRLCESMGRAERINGTVFPVTYRILVHIFIYLFLITLSLGLVETIGLFEIPFLISIASTFFLLEETATYLQDPFVNKPTDTPVTAIARNIEINIKQLLQEPQVPAPLKPEEFYLM